MNYKDLASTIIELVGGKKNVNNVTHCVTRLRFSLVNESLAQTEKIEKLDGVIGVKKAADQYQVIIGTAIEDVYKEVEKMIDHQEEHQKERKKITVKGLAKEGLDTLVSCFTPTIPVIAGSGMIKVLLVVLSSLGWMSAESSTYATLYFIGDAVFYFLPFFVAFNAAKKMKVDIFLSMTLAAILLHPNLLALGELSSYSGFFGLGLQILNYSTQALPAIFAVWLLKYVDKFADKVSPNIVKVFLRPMISLLIVAPIMLIFIGPASSVVGDWFAALANIMMDWGWLAVGINAAIFPLMVLTGTHNATIPFIIQLFATQGFDPIFLPSGMAANIAEAGAAGAVAFKTKNKALKGTALSASFSALLGITEPALYGVNLRLKKPFIAVLLGGLLGGCYIGFVGLTAPTFVTPSLITIPVYIGTGVNFLIGLSSIPVVFIITFIITYLFGFEDIEDENITNVASPIKGKIMELDKVDDEAFSTKMMGEGFAVNPTEGKVIAPFHAQVTSLFPTHHAIGLTSENGLEVLIHIGIDTVNLNGKYFNAKVKQGDYVSKGDTLIAFDLDNIKKEGYDTTTMIVVTNTKKYKNIALDMKEGILHVE